TILRHMSSPSIFPITTHFRSDLSLMLDLSEIPLLFVTVSDQRVNTAEWAFRRAFEAHQATWDRVFFMKEKQEVEFLKGWKADSRSEEHTSELQSRENLVCRLL